MFKKSRLRDQLLQKAYYVLHIFHFHGYITDKLTIINKLPDGLIAQLVEHCTGIAEVMGSNPFQAWLFFTLSFCNCLSCVHNCVGHSVIQICQD